MDQNPFTDLRFTDLLNTKKLQIILFFSLIIKIHQVHLLTVIPFKWFPLTIKNISRFWL